MKSIRKILHSYVHTFALLFILCVPFPYYLFAFQEKITTFLFTKPLISLSPVFFHTRYATNSISSDSTLMYMLVLLILAFSLPVALISIKLKMNETNRSKLNSFIQTILFYFLALQLAKYGFDKVFKMQFYLPEPNTLFTPFGFLGKDILYWSTIGTSHSYNVFTGALEIIAAALLLFRRTRVLGLLVCIGILIHICMINFSFDISVKLFSLFLLFLSVLLIYPFLKTFLDFFLKNKNVRLHREETQEHFIQSKAIRNGIKFFVIGMITLEALYPALSSGNINDDKAARPFLHGAFEITEADLNGEKLITGESPVKRIFIHRNNYIIFQDQRDKMRDYQLEIDQPKNVLILTDYSLKQTQLNYSYSPKDSLLTLNYQKNGIEYKLKARELDWRKLPALKKGFHFRSDSGI